MNLMTQAVENIYKYGNTSLIINSENIIITFFVENDKLNIKMERCFEKGLSDEFYLSLEEGLAHIACLAYYSINNYRQITDDAQLTTTTNEDNNTNNNIKAINELYNQFVPMLSTTKNILKL